MTQLDYYRQEPREDLPHRGGLTTWGTVMIVFGSLSAVIAVLMAVFWFIMVMGFIPVPRPRGGLMTSAMITGVLVYVVAAVILIWLGRGSQLGRRWIRPVMISGTIVTAFSGLAALVPLIIGFIAMARNPTPYFSLTATTNPTTSTVTYTASGTTYARSSTASSVGSAPNLTAVGLFSGSCSVLLMEAFPLILLWFYGRSSVQATLDRLDPNPRWTDRCPQAVLTWYFVCLFQGWGLVAASTRAVIPCFATVLVGLPAVALLLLLAGLMMGGGYLCYRMNPLGLVFSVIACAFMLGSYLTFAILGDKQLYLDQMFESLPVASRGVAERMVPNIWASPVTMYTISLIYAAWILKRFIPKPPSSATVPAA